MPSELMRPRKGEVVNLFDDSVVKIFSSWGSLFFCL